MEKILLAAARRLLLAVQGLEKPAPGPASRDDVLAVIRRMGFLQIDTIHVVARSPYLVLWSRLGDYPPSWLDELLQEGALFEYWAHAMCFLPIEDYPLFRRRMLDAASAMKWPLGWAVDWIRDNPDAVEQILSRIHQNGGVRSAEFENKSRPPGGWWNWKDEKNTLEALFLTGELMIARRQNFQRVYDLRNRVLPGWDDTRTPSTEEVQRALVLRAVQALGAATPAWVSDYFRQERRETARILQALAAEGMLLEVELDGSGPAYLHPANLPLLEQAARGGDGSAYTTLLSPFDPLVADRQRARQLFNFDYTIECYTPIHKRRYGYYTMPILHNGRLVGRLDPKAHRARGVFEVKSIHLEDGVEVDEALVAGLARALQRLAGWHGTPQVIVGATNPPALAGALQTALVDPGS